MMDAQEPLKPGEFHVQTSELVRLCLDINNGHKPGKLYVGEDGRLYEVEVVDCDG